MSRAAALSIYLSLCASSALGYAVNVTRRGASEFQADSSINVKALYNFVKAGSGKVLATYSTCNDCDNSVDVKLHSQSDKMKGVVTFMADMDIDCDGKNWQCPGNPDGQPQTTFGSADTYQMPWYVLPDEWYESQGIVANALGAIICNNKMFYAVFADSNGDSPQVIGETSLVLGNACFPNAGLSGAVGHSEVDIAYIVFGPESPEGVGEETLEYGPLKKLGDKKVKELMAALKLGGKSTPETDPETPEEDPETQGPETEDPETPEEPPQEDPETQDPETQDPETQDPEAEPEVPPPTCNSKGHKKHHKNTRRAAKH